MEAVSLGDPPVLVATTREQRVVLELVLLGPVNWCPLFPMRSQRILRALGGGIQRARRALVQAAAGRERELRQSRSMVDRLKRANEILTEELISVKEQLAQCKSDRDIIIEELKLCEELGTLHSEDRHAHDPERRGGVCGLRRHER